MAVPPEAQFVLMNTVWFFLHRNVVGIQDEMDAEAEAEAEAIAEARRIEAAAAAATEEGRPIGDDDADVTSTTQMYDGINDDDDDEEVLEGRAITGSTGGNGSATGDSVDMGSDSGVR